MIEPEKLSESNQSQVANISQEGVRSVRAEFVRMHQAAAESIRADDVALQQSAASDVQQFRCFERRLTPLRIEHAQSTVDLRLLPAETPQATSFTEQNGVACALIDSGWRRLRRCRRFGLALTGAGSFAGSPTIMVNSGTTLNVSGVTGGANHDGTRFALASGESLILLVDGVRYGFATSTSGTAFIGRRGYTSNLYRVPPDVLIAIANAKEVKLRFRGVNSVVERTMNDSSRMNFRKFITKYFVPAAPAEEKGVASVGDTIHTTNH